MVTKSAGCGGVKGKRAGRHGEDVSPASLVLAALRKSMVAGSVESPDDVISRHVTFDRFNGFLGVHLELDVDVPVPVPSASVCLVYQQSQCSVLMIQKETVSPLFLLMQDRLYLEENSEEEHLRDQLNRGIVPDDIDVRCLAGLIKAWFHELPSGVLDGLSPNKFFSATLTESAELVKQQNPTESALLNCAINLMADVVVKEEYNKMDARNIAMVFAPNMMQVPWFMVASIYGCGSEISTKQ